MVLPEGRNYSLTENVICPFQAEPAQKYIKYLDLIPEKDKIPFINPQGSD